MFVCTEYIHTYFVKLNLRRKEKKDLPSVIPKHTTKIVHFNATDYIFLKKILISDYYCYTKYPLLEMFVQSN